MMHITLFTGLCLVCCLLLVAGCRGVLDKLETMLDMAEQARRSRDNVIALSTRRKKNAVPKHGSAVISGKKSSTH